MMPNYKCVNCGYEDYLSGFRHAENAENLSD